MPIVLIIAGSILLIAAVRGTQQDLFKLVASDFTGPNNFIFWFLSIVVIGAIGYIPKMKPISDAFLILVILTLFLRKGTGFFDKFQSQVGSTQAASPVVGAGGTTAAGFYGSLPGGGGASINVGTGGVNVGVGSGGVSVGTGGVSVHV